MNPNMQKLINALMSGKYKQNYGSLREGDAYCCLGVACEVYRQDHPDEFYWDKKNFTFVRWNNDPGYYGGSMPEEVFNYFGFNL